MSKIKYEKILKKGWKGKIPKGFSKGYVPITHEIYINCDFITCEAGLGMAGRGHCYLNGYWWWHKCPKFKKNKNIT